MKRTIKMGLLGLLTLSLLASCEKEEKPFVPKEPDLQEDYTETAFLTNMEMVYVKGGEFMMGMTPEQGWDRPDSIIKKYTRKTKLDSYHIGKYEVTRAQWKAVMGNDNSHEPDDKPKVWVNWEDAQEFCKKLSEMTGKKYVLPTSAQWEYAARGGVHKTETMYAGSNDIDEVAWYDENSYNLGIEHPDYGSHPVGSKKANALGLYDMSGNVWEYCSDWVNAGYDKNDDYNPQGPASGSHHVLRGGNYGSSARECSVSYPGNDYDVHVCFIGFRVAVLP